MQHEVTYNLKLTDLH